MRFTLTNESKATFCQSVSKLIVISYQGFPALVVFFPGLAPGAIGNRFYMLVVVLLVRLSTRCVEQSSEKLNTRLIEHFLVYGTTLYFNPILGVVKVMQDS